jgi:hypothetical protein
MEFRAARRLDPGDRVLSPQNKRKIIRMMEIPARIRRAEKILDTHRK